MADGDRSEADDSNADRGTANRERDRTDRGFFGGVSFELPPITFPAFFPEDFRMQIPIPESVRTAGSPLLAAFTIDLIDAVAILTVGPAVDWLRVFVGLGVMALVFGPVGLLYSLETIPILIRSATVGLVPTATVVALAHRVR